MRRSSTNISSDKRTDLGMPTTLHALPLALLLDGVGSGVATCTAEHGAHYPLQHRLLTGARGHRNKVPKRSLRVS